MSRQWKVGDLVRYGYGSTALAVLHSPHAGGWHAYQCMGGITFVHDAGWGEHRLIEPSEQDRQTWNDCAKWRDMCAALVSDPRGTSTQEARS
jgi:hypothetical protein